MKPLFYSCADKITASGISDGSAYFYRNFNLPYFMVKQKPKAV